MTWPEAIFYTALVLVGVPFGAWLLACFFALFFTDKVPDGLLPFGRKK